MLHRQITPVCGLLVFLLTLVSTPLYADAPTGAELIRHVRQAEQWIHRVDSLWLKLDGMWHRTEAGIAARRQELREQFGPDFPLTPESDTALRPEVAETYEFAFDDRRLWKHQHVDKGHDFHMIWDGQQLTGHRRYFTHDQEEYILDNELTSFVEPISELPWLRAGIHTFWWRKPWAVEMPEAYVGEPDEYDVVGQEQFHGMDCYVVAHRYRPGVEGLRPRRYYVGVKTRRLHGMETGSTISESLALRVLREVMQNRGESVATDRWAEAEAWLRELPRDQRQATEQAAQQRLWHEAAPSVQYVLLDYKEVAPGCWLPTRQSYALFSLNDEREVYERFRRDMRVTQVRVNEKLPEEHFNMKMRPGVRVVDYRWDPPLGAIVYPHDPDRTPEAFNALLTKAQARYEKRQAQSQAKQDLIGQPAPAFPQDATWINTKKSLTWEQLRGKVVVIDFWAHWCGPCRADIPFMRGHHRNAGENGLVVLGLHTPEKDLQTIQAFLKKFEITYPICVDVPPQGEATSWGALFQAYEVRAMPHSVVVDQQGRIAAHGPLAETLPTAHALVAEAKP